MLRSYCLTLLTASVLGGIVTSLAEKPFARYVRYLAALLCIVTVVSPFRSIDFVSLLTAPLPETPSAAVPYENAVETEAYSLLESFFADELFSDTGIKAASVRIQIDWNAASPVIEALAFALENPTDERKTQAERWAVSRFGVPCTVE